MSPQPLISSCTYHSQYIDSPNNIALDYFKNFFILQVVFNFSKPTDEQFGQLAPRKWLDKNPILYLYHMDL